ncbi:hypothetical protein TNCV_708931 [Trichonephila clavipes]|nr:hypothetical protein TNCV_708931 [Trichonephila clavipes]
MISSISVIDEAITGAPEEFYNSIVIICGPKAKSIHQMSRLMPKFSLYLPFACIHQKSIRLPRGQFFDVQPIR